MIVRDGDVGKAKFDYEKWKRERAERRGLNTATTSATTGGNGGGSYAVKTAVTAPAPAPSVDIDAAFEARRKAQEAALNETLGTLQRNYDMGTANANRAADNSQQQAYIRYMESKRDMPQTLAASGLTGGASESMIGDMYNRYGQNRAAIDAERNAAIGDLALGLANDQAAARAKYDAVLADDEAKKLAYKLQMQKEAEARAYAERRAAARGSKSSGSGSSDSAPAVISDVGNAWVAKLESNMATNPYTRRMSAEQRLPQIKYAIQSAYQQGMLSREDAELIAANYGL